MRKKRIISVILVALIFLLAVPGYCLLRGGGDHASKRVLLKNVPDAENMLRTDGRLFATGGKNVYEIVVEAKGLYSKTALYKGECNFTGIARRGTHLYAACVSRSSGSKKLLLLATPLREPRFQVIHVFKKLSLPNGIVFDSQGRLYVADTALFTGKIVRLTFVEPMKVKREIAWLEKGITRPNGVRISGETLYMTDMGSVRKVRIKADGSAGSVHKIHGRFSILDDFRIIGRDLIVADFLRGTIFRLSLSNTTDGSANVKAESPLRTFSGPSSILGGDGLKVPRDSVLVTEKGILGNSNVDIGNRLSLYKLDK